MEQYKEEFIEFMVDCQVLKFGAFVTKSGRNTPFFVNTGFYRTGEQLRRLGGYYAKAIASKYGTDFDVLFGPAYKGIPLTVATSMELSAQYGADIRYCSNRKEVKDHGDKGILLGSPIGDGDRIVIIEDVTTAGTSIGETMPILKAHNIILYRNLLYTGITRARKRVVMIGQKQALYMAINRNEISKRNTLLGERIRLYYKAYAKRFGVPLPEALKNELKHAG